ncbi:hypothetical protein GCM10007086_04210 [Photobacterium aphoticum]|nr:hypothetical protein GCM10007086_04210 [Photobacterium aphoticum]
MEFVNLLNASDLMLQVYEKGTLIKSGVKTMYFIHNDTMHLASKISATRRLASIFEFAFSATDG